MANNYYTRTGQNRVWIAESGLGCNKPYIIHSCMQVSGLSEPDGEVTYDYCPDDDTPDSFNVVAEFQGTPGNIGFTLRGLLPASVESKLYKLRKRGCPFDLAIKTVLCTPATDAENWASMWVVRGARVTNWQVSELTARTPDQRAMVEEEVTVSAPPGSLQRLYNMEWTQPSFGYNALGVYYAVAICGDKNCGGGDCGETESDGCDRIFLLQHRIGVGNFLIYSIDGGETWEESRIGGNELVDTRPDRIALHCCGGKVFAAYMIAGGVVEIASTSINALVVGESPSWNIQTHQSSFPLTGSACRDNDLVLLMSNSIYTVDSDSGTLSGGSATFPETRSLGVDEDGNTLVGLANGQVRYSTDLVSWTSSAVSGGQIIGVQPFDSKNWVAFDQFGHKFCTGNAGRTWAESTPDFAAEVAADNNEFDINMFDDRAGFIAAGPNIYRTTTMTNSLRSQDGATNGNPMIKVSACPNDPNVCVAIGYAGSNGYVTIGRPATA